MSEITAEQFAARLAALCIKGVGQGMPNKVRDRHILLASIKATLDPEREYKETEMNIAISRWRAEVGIGIVLDHVTLRRHLVDEGYLVRDAAGVTYRVTRSRHEEQFDPAIERLDQAKIVADALDRREQKKRLRLSAQGDS